MIKDVLSVVLFCTLGFVLIMLCAEFVNRLGKVLPKDPEVIDDSGRIIARRDEKKLGGTDYYLTVENDAGVRMELSVTGEQYGMLIPGDRVDLSYREKNGTKKLVDFSRL